MGLINCPACGTQVSDQAKICVRCGHPLKKSRGTQFVWIVLVVLVLITAGVAVNKLMPPETLDEFLEAIAAVTNSAEQVTDNANGQEFKPRFLRGEALHKELTAYTMRLNRLTPFKPNEMVTLQRVIYQPKPPGLVFEYEMNAMASKRAVDLNSIHPILMQRYCTDPEISIASYNGVAVTWRYYKAGRLIHTHTIKRCEQ